MSLLTFLPFVVLIGAMFLMTRSAKKKQQQAAEMRDAMQPGTGVRTIGGMYATVKELHDDTVLLEVAPGVHAVYAKNAIGAVLDDEEYNRIVHGDDPAAAAPVVPDDASSLTEADHAEASDTADSDVSKIQLSKKPQGDEAAAVDADADVTKDNKADGDK
ncbi:preprotein translocase subunit YajC [Streptomyces albipurpureus]|uniref:Preprotein translocase subunit YajC n=1 Tax=Streptomyces albipurpureus TaxID=2897419 RepID=A0ABT0UWK8_9ACTN|nr:preprotein translocase subunit YajC [Streptomyces sp. CWNU-1]MCM2392834.1 preprotein translocase subunit YajC [Streptomyces sp. CWNU-1]